MSTGRTGLRTTIFLILSCAIVAVGLVGCSGASDQAMVEAAGDFVVAMVSNDGEAVVALIPSSVADEHPEYRDAEPPADAIEFVQEWDEDTLVIGVNDEQAVEVYRLQPSQNDDSAVTVDTGSDEIELAMEEHDGAWVVTQMGGDPVASILDILLLTTGTDAGTELAAEGDEMYCHTEQLIWEAAAAVALAQGVTTLDDPSVYVPDIVEELTYCPSAESQYSKQNSANGYVDGMGPDGELAPCSVHGAPDTE